jgi:hypothetical protein
MQQHNNKHRQHAQYNRGQQPNSAIYQNQKGSIKKGGTSNQKPEPNTKRVPDKAKHTQQARTGYQNPQIDPTTQA